MEKEEKDIRFVARFYRENRLDTTQAWQKLGIGKQRNNSILLYRLITIAAVTFLIAGFSWWWIYDRQDWIVIASSAHAVKEVTLPDNSHITLAENSALQYDRLAYGKKNRNVTLNGKAYFSVTHQEQCPFRVQTELANIQVLGTQFQVTANANQTSATVESGKVRFYNKEQKEAILTKGMYAFINQKGQMQINKQSDTNTFAWKTHVYVYNEAPLKKVVKVLEEVHSKFSFLLLLCLMHICIEAKGTEHDEPLVTLDMKQTPIRKVLAEITRQTGVTFSYESSLTKHLLPIDITITAQPLSHCLRILFQKLPVEYIQSGKYIILKKNQKNIVISGFIRDKSSSESLIGASIYDAKSHQGTTSNADGFFSLTLEAGNDVYLNISYVGYDSFHRSFTQLEQDTLLPVLLNSHQQLAEVVVTGEYTSSPLVQTSDMGHTRLNKDLIQQTPVLFGEADIIKTLQTLPGVSAGTAGLAGMYVRGGNGDDNLYMIEGNPLYQINHVGGLFSSFNAEAVKDVEFFKSAFPARYGGRLSSVVDIHTKDGNMKEYHGSAMLGLTSGSLNLEGPLVKDRTSFNFALRRSWIDALSAPTIAIWNATRNKGETQIVARYAFTDMNFKLNHQFNDRSRGYAGLYWGNDFLKGGEKREGDNGYESRNTGRLRWGNIMAFTGWSYVFNNQLFGNVNAAFTHYSSTLKGDYYQGTEANYVSQESSTRNRIDDLSIRANFDFRPNASHQ